MILCAALGITNHAKKIQINHGDKPAVNQIQNISANIALFLISYDMRLYHMILCPALGITNHAQKKYRSTMVTSWP